MRKSAFKAASVIAFATAVAIGTNVSPLSAQVRTTSFGVSAGVSSPSSGYLVNAKTGYNMAGHLYIQPARFDNLSFRGDLSVSNFDNDMPAGSGVRVDLRVVGFALNGLYSIPTSGSLTPYLVGGLGHYNIKISRVEGSVTRPASDANLGYGVGAGVNFQLGALSAFAEARWVNIMSEPDGTAFAPISFGLRF